jgi:hypothetical protein
MTSRGGNTYSNCGGESQDEDVLELHFGGWFFDSLVMVESCIWVVR